MKSEVVKLLAKKVKLSEKEIENLIEIPPNSEMGDFAFPCFVLTREMKKAPQQISQILIEEIRKNLPKSIKEIKANGPYVNFFIDRNSFAQELVNKILKEKERYGKNSKNKIGKVMVEFPSPNTNKPLHMGHLRNMSIGESMSRILEFNGNKTFRVNSINDRGIHICKSMLAYQKFGKGKNPDKKSDHFVGDFYVMFAKAVKEKTELEKDAQDMLVK